MTAAALGDQRIHHRVLHIPLQHTAAHEPQIDEQRLVARLCRPAAVLPERLLVVRDRHRLTAHNQRHDAVVPEPVLQSPVQRDGLRILRRPGNLRLREPLRRQIELIAFIRKLRNPRIVHRLERSDLRPHLQ